MAESRTNYEQEKHKNGISQVKRAVSMNKGNSEKETRWLQKPLQKAKSFDVIDKKTEKLHRNHAIDVGFYPGLESMINTYSDNFGYDGRKENLARKYTENATKSYPISCEPYVENYRRKHNDNINIHPNMLLKKESQIPVTSYNPVINPQIFVSVIPSIPSIPVKVNSTPKQNLGLFKGNSAGSITTIAASKLSPVTSTSSPRVSC